MGGILSKTGTGEYNEILQSASYKRQRMSCIPDEDNPRLIPNLLDDISIQILGRLPRIYYLNVKLVTRSWKRNWLGRRDPLDRLPYCGCAITVVDGCLYVLGGFSRASAVKCVWCFNPILNMWSEVESMSIGRSYYKTGVLKNKLYVVGGVSRGRGGLTPLQSTEVYDPCTGLWSEVPSMSFSKAQLLPTAFLADMLKPIATGMTTYRGRLCVPQSLYSWPFFVDVGGEVYDPESNTWLEMPSSMGDGWPACRPTGTKLSVVVEEELYALDLLLLPVC